MGQIDWRVRHVLLGLLFGVAMSYVLLSRLALESAVILIIFNFLFIPLIFPLRASIMRKLLLLSVGNLIGVSWNVFFTLLVLAVVNYVGDFVNTLYLVLSPFVNLIWIVSFWSISLSVLANARTKGLSQTLLLEI
jgi:hypothetical protein